MYPLPTGALPITGANLLAFTLAGGALIIVGVIALRLVIVFKRRRTSGAEAPVPGRHR